MVGDDGAFLHPLPLTGEPSTTAESQHPSTVGKGNDEQSASDTRSIIRHGLVSPPRAE